MVVFFFTRFDDQHSLKPETILRSVLRQALAPMDLSDELESIMLGVSLDASVELRALSELLDKRARHLNNLYIVVDGLDECGKLERKELMLELSWLCAENPKIKVFLAGRESLTSEMRQVFPPLIHVSMGFASAQSEIGVFVAGTIHERLETEDLIIEDQALVKDITNALIDGAEGM